MFIFLTAAASDMNFCIVRRQGLIGLVNISNLEIFPIYRNLTSLQFDVINNNFHNSPYPVSGI